MSAIIIAGAKLGGKELFKKGIVDLCEYVRAKSGIKLRQWSTEHQIETLYRNAAKVRKVKTIWQIDKAVDLVEFYCDSHVVVDGKRRKIGVLEDLGATGNILVEGIAGQGKSILLRYLCAVELARGTHIPIFLELRRISKEQSLRDRIVAALAGLGLTVDDALFALLASSGRIVLLLDAFDEIPDELKASVLTDIDDIAMKHDKLRIIVTSRPHQSIRMSNLFTVVTLDNLQDQEYVQVIRKLAGKQTWATSLISHIENKARHIQGLLCTPLMVTLLVLSYKSYQQLPTKLSDFYDELFQTLLQRHDGTKPGFARKRACALDDGEYRTVFEALCILCKKGGKQSFDSQMIQGLSKDAIQQCELKASAISYVDDIVRITCLILRDGEEHRFIHKTVQEYYAASFVRRKPDVWVTEFYGRLLAKNAYQDWAQELSFLSEIDSYRYRKFYLLPAMLAFLGIDEAGLDLARPPASTDWLRGALQRVLVGVGPIDERHSGVQYMIEGPYRYLTMEFVHYMIRESERHSMDKILRQRILSADETPVHNESRDHPLGIWRKRLDPSVRPLSDLLGDSKLKGLLLGVAERYCDSLFRRAKQIRHTLQERESKSLLDGLV